MARATVKRPPQFVEALADALKERLPGARVDVEHVRGSRYRFVVVWDRFNRMPHPERQRRVWAIADQVVPGKELLDVGMILTVAPDDYPGTEID